VLRLLAKEGKLSEANIWGVDQSQTAVDLVKQHLPSARLEAGDIYDLKLPKQHFDVCLLMETIEHLEQPAPALRNILDVLVPGGLLYLSFPNYLHLPWWLVRILAEKLNRPNWIVLQPIDKIYTVFTVKRLLRAAGFEFERGIGSNFGPPVLYRWERPWMTRLGNALGLWWLSFHPVLKFRKPSGK
jgi:2-polyprenyl-3-methyl-5-hydroxy-6-metoxy-1,4-benzoquinol methylase